MPEEQWEARPASQQAAQLNALAEFAHAQAAALEASLGRIDEGSEEAAAVAAAMDVSAAEAAQMGEVQALEAAMEASRLEAAARTAVADDEAAAVAAVLEASRVEEACTDELAIMFPDEGREALRRALENSNWNVNAAACELLGM